jgi:hypothetical protein
LPFSFGWPPKAAERRQGLGDGVEGGLGDCDADHGRAAASKSSYAPSRDVNGSLTRLCVKECSPRGFSLGVPPSPIPEGGDSRLRPKSSRALAQAERRPCVHQFALFHERFAARLWLGFVVDSCVSSRFAYPIAYLCKILSRGESL